MTDNSIQYKIQSHCYLESINESGDLVSSTQRSEYFRNRFILAFYRGLLLAAEANYLQHHHNIVQKALVSSRSVRP